MKKGYIIWGIVITVLLVGGFAIGWFGRHEYAVLYPNVDSAPSEIRENSQQYKFINPLIYSDTNKENFPEFVPLLSSLNSFISASVKKHDADSVSVYFRDLDTGHWTGINEDQTYEPASMLKTVVMMAYLHHAMSDPNILSQPIYYQAATTTDQYYLPQDTLQTGYYSAQQLIETMIIYSDNVAETALTYNDPTDIANVYKDFQLPPLPTDSSNYATADFMSPKSYSTLLRALYNGTYLPWNLSEQALQLLSLAQFKDGLVSGVPTGVIVAHKFGERTNELTDGTIINKELHDCGIIYSSVKPYLLCVMTKGQDFPTLANVISTISKLTYTYMENKNRSL